MNWAPPRNTVVEAIPWIPTEQETDCLIAAAPKKLSAFLQLLKKTAMKRGEAKRLQWVNVDAERSTITLNEPEKHSNPRMWKVTPRLIAQLNALPKTSDKLFGNCKMDSLKSAFLHLRKRQASKLQNPRLLKIGFHTIRHRKATMLYHETKDPFYIRFPGAQKHEEHRKIRQSRQSNLWRILRCFHGKDSKVAGRAFNVA